MGWAAVRVLVCGGREYDDPSAMREVLVELPLTAIIIHGAARGADTMAGYVGRALGFWVWACPAEWKGLGKTAGFQRNQRMLDEARPELVLAFPGGAGTADMVRRATKAGIRLLKCPCSPEAVREAWRGVP